MDEKFSSDIQRIIEKSQSMSLWVQHALHIACFSPVEGYEKKVFGSEEELMDYARACVNSGYNIG